MDRIYDAPARQFALEILRNHPQISYEHAVSAAEYRGVHPLTRGVFLAAAERLGIRRERDEPTGIPAPVPSAPLAAAPGSKLLQDLDRFRAEMAETESMRDALRRMREVVRAALAEG